MRQILAKPHIVVGPFYLRHWSGVVNKQRINISYFGQIVLSRQKKNVDSSNRRVMLWELWELQWRRGFEKQHLSREIFPWLR